MNSIARRLYDRGLGSRADCVRAADACGNDEQLAEGWLKYKDCAINIRPKNGQTREQARTEWLTAKAQEWKTKRFPVTRKG